MSKAKKRNEAKEMLVKFSFLDSKATGPVCNMIPIEKNNPNKFTSDSFNADSSKELDLAFVRACFPGKYESLFGMFPALIEKGCKFALSNRYVGGQLKIQDDTGRTIVFIQDRLGVQTNKFFALSDVPDDMFTGKGERVKTWYGKRIKSVSKDTVNTLVDFIKSKITG